MSFSVLSPPPSTKKRCRHDFGDVSMAAGLQSGDNAEELQVNNLKAIKHIKSQLNDADKMATRAGEFLKSPAFLDNSIDCNIQTTPNIKNGYCNGTIESQDVLQRFS